MTWTYELTTITSTPKDVVRLLIGDTDSTAQLLQDEEISTFLSYRPSPYGAAADCCRSLAAKYAIQATTAAGDTKISYSDISKSFAARANALDQKAIIFGSAMPYAGGISVTDKQNQVEDADRVPTNFNIGMDDNRLPIGPDEINNDAQTDPVTDNGT